MSSFLPYGGSQPFPLPGHGPQAGSTMPRILLAVDIIAFGRRDTDIQMHLHDTLYQLVPQACAASGLLFQAGHSEDRGDAIFAVAAPDTPIEAAIGLLPGHLKAGIRRHNKVAQLDARLRLRMAVESGFVSIGPNGVQGRAAVHLFRMIDAPAFKATMQSTGADFGMIVSNYLYEEVLKFGPGLIDPTAFTRVAVENKETMARAWVNIAHSRPTASAPPATANGAHNTNRRRTRRQPPRSGGFDAGPCLS